MRLSVPVQQQNEQGGTQSGAGITKHPRNPIATTTVNTVKGGPHGARKPSCAALCRPPQDAGNLTCRRRVQQWQTCALRSNSGSGSIPLWSSVFSEVKGLCAGERPTFALYCCLEIGCHIRRVFRRIGVTNSCTGTGLPPILATQQNISLSNSSAVLCTLCGQSLVKARPPISDFHSSM